MTITDEKLREAWEEMQSALLYKTGGEGVIEAALAELEQLRVTAKEYRALVQRIIGQCETNMSRCRVLEKRAIEDGHDSERWHQDGRWHGNNDVLEYAERGLAKLHTPPADNGEK